MLTIRKAREADCESISSVHTAAVRAIRTTLYTPEEIQAWATPKTPENYAESVRTKEFFVAVEGGAILDSACSTRRVLRLRPFT